MNESELLKALNNALEHIKWLEQAIDERDAMIKALPLMRAMRFVSVECGLPLHDQVVLCDTTHPKNRYMVLKYMGGEWWMPAPMPEGGWCGCKGLFEVKSWANIM